MTITIDGDDKLLALEQIPLSCLRRRDVEETLTSIESTAFASLNSAVRWLGIPASILCAEFSIRMQQTAPTAVVRDLAAQASGLKQLKKYGSSVSYHRLADNQIHKLSLLVFSDAGRHCDSGQICYVAGLLVDGLEKGSLYHVLAWSSHRAKRLVTSIGAAEILVAGEAIYNGKLLSETLSAVYGIKIPLLIAVNSMDFFSSHSTQRSSIDKRIRAHVNVIRHEFEQRNIDKMIWIPGRENLADPGTKSDSLLIDVLRLALHDGRLPLDFARAETCASARPLGYSLFSKTVEYEKLESRRHFSFKPFAA